MERRRAVELAVAALLGLVALRGWSEPQEPRPDALERQPIDEAQEVRPGAVVHLEFTLQNDQGEILDSSRGRAPLVFTQGAGQIISGLDRGVLGMKVGQQKTITVAPADAYGPVDPEAVTEVPKSRIPPEALHVGAWLTGQTRSGREVPVRVREIKDETIVLDLNHPLAGQTLVFEVTIILIEPPPP